MSKGNGAAHINADDRDPNKDLIDAGFRRLDPELIKDRPPKIKWGMLYMDSPLEKRLAFAEKLASSMNHAAWLIQNERNELGQLCEKKEKQLESMKKSLVQNNEMIQKHITDHNAEIQEYNAAIKKLKDRIRELERGDNN